MPESLVLEEFSPCEYLPHLQQILFATDELNENVTYQNFIIVPASYEQLGDVNIDGKFVRTYKFSYAPAATMSLFHYQLIILP